MNHPANLLILAFFIGVLLLLFYFTLHFVYSLALKVAEVVSLVRLYFKCHSVESFVRSGIHLKDQPLALEMASSREAVTYKR